MKNTINKNTIKGLCKKCYKVLSIANYSLMPSEELSVLCRDCNKEIIIKCFQTEDIPLSLYISIRQLGETLKQIRTFIFNDELNIWVQDN